ncbi:MAG: hypothetical protein ACE5K0_08060, partial [Candidatus Methanofastidiosia archaeon]
YEKALEIQTKYNMERESALTHAAIGTLWREKKKYEDALENFNIAKELFNKYRNIKMISNVSLDIAITSYLMKKYEDCLIYMKICLESAMQTDQNFYVKKFINISDLMKKFVANKLWEELSNGIPQFVEIYEKHNFSDEVTFFLCIQYFSDYKLNKDKEVLKDYEMVRKKIKNESLLKILDMILSD